MANHVGKFWDKTYYIAVPLPSYSVSNSADLGIVTLFQSSTVIPLHITQSKDNIENIE